MNFNGITRKPVFWISQILIFLICSGLTIYLYPKAFPVVDLEIKMNRAAALKTAAELSKVNHWVPSEIQGETKGEVKQSARFELDEQAQTFIELTCGGSSAFAKVLKEGLYYPYTWKVRNYAEGNTSETIVRFTPQGEFYSFGEKLPENESGAALKVGEAQVIAEEGAKKFGVKLTDFQLVEKSLEIKPGHRVDHTFVYERPNLKIGEGQYRLRLVVAGDKLVGLSHFIKIPDAFIRRYAEMRSSNDTISVVSTAAIAVLYVFCGCVLGLFLLAKKRWVLWKMPLIFGIIVAGFQFLEQLNHLPLVWMDYDTALSSGGFLLRQIASSVAMFVFEVIMLTVSFAAAESLSRRAFPDHPQFWKIWTARNASTYNVIGRTLGGYLSLGFFFLYVVVIYLFGTRYLGWWSPSDTLFHPDVLATYCPWFTSISNSLHAGFWEESLFRAVPLAAAALLGERFGGRKKWITFGFIIQALVFASAHANYPAQPSYARVVELIIPSLFFGGVYLVFGLLPGIILHFTFDTVSFALPLFAANTPGIWVERGLVIFFALIPLWIVLASRFATRSLWLAPSELNGAWKPSDKPSASELGLESSLVEPGLELKLIHPLYEKLILLISSLAVLFWLLFFPFENQGIRLNVSRVQAIEIARKALDQSGFKLSPSWNAGAFISEGSEQEEDFVWKTGGLKNYQKLLGSYLQPAGWIVRFFRFDTDVAERAEDFQVFIYNSGEIYRIRHQVPEGRALPSLTEDAARKVALNSLQKMYGIAPSDLSELSSAPAKLPARTDWSFVFLNRTQVLPMGEARVAVRVVGDSVGAIRRFVFIPENWSRQERSRQNILGLVRGVSSLTVALILLMGVGVSLRKWVQHSVSFSAFWIWFLAFFGLNFAGFLNGLPPRLAMFSTEAPRFNQFVTLICLGFIKILFVSGSLALLLSYILQVLKRQPRLQSLTSIRVGYSIGILGAFLLGGVSHFMPHLGPIAGKLDPLNDFIPWLYGLHTVISFTSAALFFLLIGSVLQDFTRGWKKNQLWAGLILAFLGFILSGLQAEELIHWLVTGSCLGLVLIIGYRFIIMSTLNLIPLATAGVLILSELNEMNLNAYLGSRGVTGVCLVLVVLVSGLFVPLSSPLKK